MVDLVSAMNLGSAGIRAINSGPSNTVTNTTTETIFNQVWKFPDQTQRITTAPTMVRISASGIISTALIAPSFTLRVRWGGISGTVVCSTGAFSLTSSLSDAGWIMDATMLITATGSSGSAETQGYCSFQSGLLTLLTNYMVNTTPITLNTQVASDVVVTAQWSSASSSNSIKMNTLVCELDGP